MGFDADILKLLGPALEAGRKALRDMEPKEIPVALRKVAASTGGKLPPPFAARLLAALDGDDGLRAKALEAAPEVGNPGDAAGPAQRASAAFLAREEGWWGVVAAARAEVAEVAAAGRSSAVRKEAERAKAETAEARKREREARERETRAVTVAKAEVTDLRDRLRAAREADGRAVAGVEEARQRAEDALADVSVDRDILRSEVTELRARWRRARRELADAERAARAGATGSLPADPLARAKLLDEIATLSRVPAESPAVTAGDGTASGAFAVPPGISPDRGEALEWLTGEDRRFTLVVDGYNVTFLMADDFSSGAARDHLNLALGRLQRAMRAGSVIVVYDSHLAGQREAITGPDGVEIRFSPEGTSADDTVVALAAELDGPVAVVSTDREVRERAAARGAVTLWSEALVEWIGR